MKKGILIVLTIAFSIQLACGKADDKNKPIGLTDFDNKEKVVPRVPMDEYTKEAPAEWSEIADDHLPTIQYLSGELTDNVRISLSGTGFNDSHYIEKIGIMDKNKRTLVVKELKRGNTKPSASLTLKEDPIERKDLKVFVKCNLHDLWTVKLHEAINAPAEKQKEKK